MKIMIYVDFMSYVSLILRVIIYYIDKVEISCQILRRMKRN